ncbi:MAG: aminotransferase class V-fold PLP-dependent enzyme [Gammaproteobacteria bacterium]
MQFDVESIRKDFPILDQKINGFPLVYLDNAATSQKPQYVIDVIENYYSYMNANVHRGVHFLSERATWAYEAVRDHVQHFINARSRSEIVFMKGTTDAINLVAQSYARPLLKPGDEIVITHMEHHSNIVPWQLVCEQTGAVLRVVPITDTGELILEEYEKYLTDKTKLVAVTHVSNSLGTINPVEKMITLAQAKHIPVLLDGAQAIVHLDVDVQKLKCDFYVFSGHKLFGPTGIGILYGKEELLTAMPPYQGGGEMIEQVSFTKKTTYKTIPYKFEAGTPHIEGVIGLGAALDYLSKLDRKAAHHHEQQLLKVATQKILEIPGVTIIGTAKEKIAILSFVMDSAHPHDISTILDHQGIAIRAGHHCTMPLMERLNLPATARASFAFYNTFEEVDEFIKGLLEVRKIFH